MKRFGHERFGVAGHDRGPFRCRRNSSGTHRRRSSTTAATLDYQHDEFDRGRVKIACAVLALWSDAGSVANWYEPLDVGRVG
jgi:hypothetical protein